VDETQLDPYPFTFMAHSFTGTAAAFFLSHRIHDGAAVETSSTFGTRLASATSNASPPFSMKHASSTSKSVGCSALMTFGSFPESDQQPAVAQRQLVVGLLHPRSRNRAKLFQDRFLLFVDTVGWVPPRYDSPGANLNTLEGSPLLSRGDRLIIRLEPVRPADWKPRRTEHLSTGEHTDFRVEPLSPFDRQATEIQFSPRGRNRPVPFLDCCSRRGTRFQRAKYKIARPERLICCGLEMGST